MSAFRETMDASTDDKEMNSGAVTAQIPTYDQCG